MSGMAHLARLRRFKHIGYRIEIIFLKLNSPELAIRRVAARVKQGGHDVPAADILRRFQRGWKNFCDEYRLVSDGRTVYDNSGDAPIREKESNENHQT
jgi:predicted ABC-type ATPase